MNRHGGVSPDELSRRYSAAVQHYQAGQFEVAARMCEAMLSLGGPHPAVYGLLGTIAYQAGRYEEAVNALSRSARLDPSGAEVQNTLGCACQALGKYQQAERAFRKAISLGIGGASVWYNLGNMHSALGRDDEAIKCYRHALEINPQHAGAWNNLGLVLGRLGSIEEADNCHGRALFLDPRLVGALINRALLYQKTGRLQQAEDYLLRAIDMEPDNAEAHNNLGILQHAQGKTPEAIGQFERALSLQPGMAHARTNLLLLLNCTTIDPDTLYRRHREWGTRHAATGSGGIVAHDNTALPDRKLRIGYVSPDFRQHSCAYFIEPLFQAHDRSQVEIVCYSEVTEPDEVTARLRAHADVWYDTTGKRDEEIVRRIREDRIDILVDLAGQTANNRLTVFAHKPAPVQVTWLGYGTTTGLTQIDYKLSDIWLTPGESGELFTEHVYNMDRCFIVYQPPRQTPDVNHPPCIETGYVSFGSFNDLAKLSPEVIACWSRILLRVPRSRLFIKARQSKDPQAQTNILRRFHEHEIASDRIVFLPYIPDSTGHFAAFHAIDICLDTFPYNGCTTTCDALWMGLPVVTLAGDRSVARYGVTLLSAVGLTELIAGDPEQYVEIAASLARNPDRLAMLRSRIRPSMAASDLCDAAGFARAMEKTYRDVWQRWCQSGAGGNQDLSG